MFLMEYDISEAEAFNIIQEATDEHSVTLRETIINPIIEVLEKPKESKPKKVKKK